MAKTLVVFDSAYGNTEKVARAIAAALGTEPEVVCRRVTEVATGDLTGVSLLVVGSPTQGFRPTKPVAGLLKGLRSRALTGVKAAAFDTRFEVARLTSGALRLLVKTGGFAAPRIAARLQRAGAALILPPEGFFVEDTE